MAFPDDFGIPTMHDSYFVVGLGEYAVSQCIWAARFIGNQTQACRSSVDDLGMTLLWLWIQGAPTNMNDATNLPICDDPRCMIEEKQLWLDVSTATRILDTLLHDMIVWHFSLLRFLLARRWLACLIYFPQSRPFLSSIIHPLCMWGGIYGVYQSVCRDKTAYQLLSEFPPWAPGISAPLLCFIFCLLLLKLWEALRPIIQMVFQLVVLSGKAHLFARWLGSRMLSDMQRKKTYMKG